MFTDFPVSDGSTELYMRPITRDEGGIKRQGWWVRVCSRADDGMPEFLKFMPNGMTPEAAWDAGYVDIGLGRWAPAMNVQGMATLTGECTFHNGELVAYRTALQMQTQWILSPREWEPLSRELDEMQRRIACGRAGMRGAPFRPQRPARGHDS